MSLRKLCIATPCYGGMLSDLYLHSILELSILLGKEKIDHALLTLRNESLITRARNSLVAMFLGSDCTDLIFIDADVQFDPESVLRMLRLDKPVVGAACPMKGFPLQYAVKFCFAGDAENRQLIEDRGVLEVEEVGSSFLLIQRGVFEKLIKAFPHLHYENRMKAFSEELAPYFFSFFDTMNDPESGRYLSEDYTFCHRWRQIGGKVWIDPQTRLTHVGSYTFHGNIGDLITRSQDGSFNLKKSTFNHTIASIFPEADSSPPVMETKRSSSEP
jgi:hypothetical protein